LKFLSNFGLTDLSGQIFVENFSFRGCAGDNDSLEAGQDGQVEAVRGRGSHLADVLDGEAQQRVLPLLQIAGSPTK